MTDRSKRSRSLRARGPAPLDTLVAARDTHTGRRHALDHGAPGRRTTIVRGEDDAMEAELLAHGGHRIYTGDETPDDPAAWASVEGDAAPMAGASADARTAPDPELAAMEAEMEAAERAARRAKYAALYPPVNVDGRSLTG